MTDGVFFHQPGSTQYYNPSEHPGRIERLRAQALGFAFDMRVMDDKPLDIITTAETFYAFLTDTREPTPPLHPQGGSVPTAQPTTNT